MKQEKKPILYNLGVDWVSVSTITGWKGESRKIDKKRNGDENREQKNYAEKKNPKQEKSNTKQNNQ